MDPILLVWIGITVVIIAGALVIRKRNSQQD
ncbi:MAG TPA: LPXTG cell wall anchor domain-containing protein [Synergistales bacterium]|nr:LPXTG cell wall anchor domain-containing protein [Synergistales bacterium]